MPAIPEILVYVRTCRACRYKQETEEERSLFRECPNCGKQDAYTYRDRYKGSAPAFSLHDFGCTRCKFSRLDVEVERGEDIHAPRACPNCDPDGAQEKTYTVQSRSEINRWGEVFTAGGYFDRGLGVYVTSKEDRLQKAAALGFVPGEADPGAALAARRREREANQAEYQRQQDLYENHPAYRGYRIARDQGRI